ncbi:MAG: hypothetical protein KF678_03590 [Phycisphaeraceae bacterium]|nr:hypothetical protein [Phycisphaeraceae bacterium]
MKYAFVLILALHWIVPLQAAQTPHARDADIAARAVFAELVDEWVRDANCEVQLCGISIAALAEMDERSINSLRWLASPDRFDQWKAAQSRRETLVRSNPSSFVPVIREALRLPKPEDLQVPTTKEGRTEDAPEQYRKQLATCNAAYQVLALLPAVMRDPILRDTFDAMLTKGREAALRYQPEYLEWIRAGRPKDTEAAVMTNSRRASWYLFRAGGAITCATSARSEVLVEPVFALLASEGGGLAQTCVDYLERFPQRYEEFIRRLSEILDSGRPLGSDRRYNIEQAIKRMEASKS